MIAVLDGEPCPACGRSHTLYLDDHALAWANRDFAYTCPVTGRAATVHTAAWDRLAADRPDGAVALHPAGE